MNIKISQIISKLRADFDLNTTVMITGFLLAIGGGCLLSIPWTLVLLGAVLVILSTIGVIWGSR